MAQRRSSPCAQPASSRVKGDQPSIARSELREPRHPARDQRERPRYNRYVIRPPLLAAAASIVLLAGCSKDVRNQDAVRQGVMSYLSKRADLLAMDVSVTSVAFHEDEATAQVHFQAKGSTSPAAGMNMQYVLERKGSDWVVKGRTGANSAHGAGGFPSGGAPAAPQNSPGPLDGMPRIPAPGGAGSATLPPGHPTVGSSQALPPGHPAVAPPGHPE